MTAEAPFPPPVDMSTALKLLRVRYPDVLLWFGKSTFRYWALVNNRLMEAETPERLANMIDSAGPRMRWQCKRRYSRPDTDLENRRVGVRRRP